VIAPDDNVSSVTPLWLAYASGVVLAAADPTRVVPPWHLNDIEAQSVRNNSFVTDCELNPVDPHLPVSIRWSFPPRPTAVRKPITSPPTVQALQTGSTPSQTVGDYAALAMTNLAGLSLPLAFVLTLYHYPGEPDRPRGAQLKYIWRGNASSVRTVGPQADYRPRLERLTNAVVRDLRFTERVPPAIVSYTSTNQSWRSVDDPALQAQYRLEVQAARGIQRRHPLLVVLLAAVTTSPAVVWLVKGRRRREEHQRAE
jgi:hypothetical protein